LCIVLPAKSEIAVWLFAKVYLRGLSSESHYGHHSPPHAIPGFNIVRFLVRPHIAAEHDELARWDALDARFEAVFGDGVVLVDECESEGFGD